MCVDCVLASPRIAQVDPGDKPHPEVVPSQEFTWQESPAVAEDFVQDSNGKATIETVAS
jgi:hypothetical protein